MTSMSRLGILSLGLEERTLSSNSVNENILTVLTNLTIFFYEH